jgi:7,8-dihydropterin-6-yl-methyl-4-(beta-D-ribofuranosyl)aminobenzene 5'-phosphate synthase
VAFDNVRLAPNLSTGWGFACLVRIGQRAVLFDTGGNGDLLLNNLRQLGVHPRHIDTVMISHLHADHMGGLEHFLRANPAAIVYTPASIALPLRRMVAGHGTRIKAIARPQHLFSGIHSTGEFGEGVGEQALIAESPEGPILITGCAHAGIDILAEAATHQLGRPLHLLMGGYHLRQKQEMEVLGIIARLKVLGVRHVAPSHCTGELATALLREAWGDRFLASGCGADFSFRLPDERPTDADTP